MNGDLLKKIPRCTACGGDLENYSGIVYAFYRHQFCEVCHGTTRGHFVQVMADRIAKLEAQLAEASR